MHQVEDLIGEPLPAEASEYAWWRVNGDGTMTPQSRVLEDAGFGIEHIEKLGDKVTYVAFGRRLHRGSGVCVTSTELGQLPFAERLHRLSIGYLESGKLLCIHHRDNPADLTWSRGAVVCFCYRHAIELFLKSCILHREPIATYDHKITALRHQYSKLYPDPKSKFHTLYDISVKDLDLDIEDFEKNEDQVYRYFSDKQGRSPKGVHIFRPVQWLSMLDRLERDINRIRKHIGESTTSCGNS